MVDYWKDETDRKGDPAENAAVIAPNDDNDLPVVTRAMLIGGAGDIRVTMVGGQTLTIEGLNSGQLLPIRATKVFATGTTATKLTGLW